MEEHSMSAIFFLAGLFLALCGAVVTTVFWVPRLFDKKKLREMLGPKYPLVFVIYIANGPLLLFLGLFLVFRFH